MFETCGSFQAWLRAGELREGDGELNKERLGRYSLMGPENQAAVQVGLAGADWFRSAVPRKRMKELMRRSDYPAIRDTVIWLGLIGLFAGLGIAFWGTWWALPFFLAYGLLYGSTSDSRWHEAGHGTAFKTRWWSAGTRRSRSCGRPGWPGCWSTWSAWSTCRSRSRCCSGTRPGG